MVCGVKWCCAERVEGSEFCVVHKRFPSMREAPPKERQGDDDECPECDGSGECSECKGTGEVPCTCDECGDEHDRECDECDGSGDCPECEGAKRAETQAARQAADAARRAGKG